MTTAFSYEASLREDIQIFAASFAQQHCWILDQLEPNSTINTISAIYHLKRPLVTNILERSLNAIVQRHQVLRTTFRMLEEQLVQVIASTWIVPLAVVDLRSLPEAERDHVALHLAKEEPQRPFDLTLGPLLRSVVLRLADEEYMLQLTAHRIICDRWSLDVLFRELVTLYESYSTGQSLPLPELPSRYTDITAWQHEAKLEDALTEHLAYWKQRLTDSPMGLDLPTDRPRLPVPTLRSSTYSLMLPRALIDTLNELSHRQGVKLYRILVAAFQTLLYRYTGQEDLVIGAITAGRTQAKDEALIGLFENMLVLRADLSGNPSFLELLWRVDEVIHEAQAHQDLPFEYLIKELRPGRQLGQNPFFQVSVTLEPTLSTLPLKWTTTQMKVETGTSRFDLALELDNRPEGLTCRFEYSTDLFDAETIARMAGHWQMLLEGIVADPAQRIGALPLLTETERHQQLVEWNGTQAAYPKDKCVHQLFEEQVERTPEAVAVVFENTQLTYLELNRRANQLAHNLQKLGVGPEVLVGICVERSLDMLVGLLGILKAGGAYVPLDANYPVERLAFMLEDTQAPVLLTQSHLQERLPRHVAQTVYLDADQEDIVHHPVTAPRRAVRPYNLAYVLYTSGSTGKPKGVAIEHRSSVTFIDWATNSFSPQQLTGVLASTSINFDLSVYEIFVPLCCGGAVILCENLLHLSSLLAARQVTLINTVPSVLAEFLKENALPASVRVVNLAGEPLSRALAQRTYQQETVQQVFNLYGPTEDTTYSTWSLVQKDASDAPAIGRPLPGTQIYILDQHLQPVPIGVAGELYLGGEKLARGYLNRPELTAERFLRNPFSNVTRARIYKTGDLARYRPDGTIEHLGRLDFQVKLRGFRIEMGEIEAVLAQHHAVRQAVVVAHEDVPGDKRLVAYIVLDQATWQKDQFVEELRGFLKETLPHYMIPAAFVYMDALPLTPNGKVDRNALPPPEAGGRRTSNQFAAPTLPLHHQLRQIWEDLLGVHPIGIKDDFFDLGGHSLLAIRLIDRISQVCGKRLPFSTLFAGTTIEHLTAVLMEDAKTDFQAPLVAVQADGSRRPFFFLHGEWSGGAFYSMQLARSLGQDQPFYLLEPYRFDGLRVPPTFEAIATAHIEALRSVQPEGPYLLGGWCNGGLMAYEMARQLHARGQTVDLLVLMDSDPPSPWKWTRRIIIGLGNLLRLGQEKQVDWFLSYRYLRLSFHYWRLSKLKHMRTTEQGKSKIEQSTVEAETPELDIVIPRNEVLRKDWLGIYHWVASGYVPHSYPGKITFFWTAEEPLRRERWHKLMEAKIDANKVEIHTIPGNHMTSRTRYLPVLAEQLGICLSKVQSTSVS
jgi:amino acid adenylation domain-containing protein